MARTGTNKTGSGVGPLIFDWRYPIAALALFGTYALIADAGQPELATLLAVGTFALVMFKRPDYVAYVTDGIANLATKIGG